MDRDDAAGAAQPDFAAARPEGVDVEARAVQADVARRLFPSRKPIRARFGRYVVVRRVGSGGRGVVYAAHDPRLDRTVAVKILRPELRGRQERERLLREANVLARLTHPNIVEVYDAGELSDDVFIVMELVDGESGWVWMRAHPRDWRSVLDVFMQAGRGLAGAHAVDIVHRDFKPANFLLGRDGRVRVVDFGLARGPVVPDQEAADATPSSPSDPAQPSQTSSRAGTRPYMAPEQRRGTAVGPLVDQYAFCVALHEALFGFRPVDGARVRPAKTASDPAVPRWLWRAVQRGLSDDPRARWPSMDALVAALRAGRRRARTAWAASLGAVAVAGGVAFGVHAVGSAGPSCSGLDAELGGALTQERSASVRRAFEATGLGYASDTADRVLARIDGYADAWVKASVDACEAAQRSASSPSALVDRRGACLGRARARLVAVLDVLEMADAKAVESAFDVVAGLTPLEHCASQKVLLADFEPPSTPARRAAVEQLRGQKERVEALDTAGRHEEALALAELLLHRATELGYEPLRAETLMTYGWSRMLASDYAGAVETMEEAFFAARAVGHGTAAAQLAMQLFWVHAIKRADYDAADRWRRHARAEVQGLGDPWLVRRLDRIVGEVAVARGDDARGLDLLEDCARWAEAQGRMEFEKVARSHMGAALDHLGRPLEAAAAFTRALELSEQLLGPAHPRTGSARVNLCVRLLPLGQYARAAHQCESAVRALEAAWGPDYHDLGGAYTNLAHALVAVERDGDALVAAENALRINEATLGPEHPDVAVARLNFGGPLIALGRYEEVFEGQRRALRTFEAKLGPGHPYAHFARAIIAEAQLGLKRPHEALELLAVAVPGIEKAMGPEHPMMPEVLYVRGHARLALGRNRDATADFERALRIREVGLDPIAIAKARFDLAQALVADPAERTRALQLAAEARDAFAASGVAARKLARTTAWLDEHAAP